MRTLSLRLTVLLIGQLPMRLRRAAIRWLAGARYKRRYHGTRHKAANIREHLGVSSAEAEQLLRRAYELDLWNILEGARLGSLDADDIGRLIELRGLERLEAALGSGRGAVLTGGHVAGMHLFFGALGVLGYRLNLIRFRVSEQKRGLSRWAHERHNARLERTGVQTLWMAADNFGVGVQAVNALRRNEVVGSPIDLTLSDDNARVEFLGAAAAFPRGLAKVAKAAGSPVLDFFVYRDAGGRLVGEIGEPYTVTDVDAAVQHSAELLEAHIRRHPADWGPWHVFDEWRELGPQDLRVTA